MTESETGKIECKQSSSIDKNSQIIYNSYLKKEMASAFIFFVKKWDLQ